MASPRADVYFQTISILLSSWAIGAAAVPRAPTVPTPPKPQARLTAEQHREVKGLLTEYRQAVDDLEKKGQIVEEALEIGPGAVAALLTAVERDMQPALRRYSGLFQQQAAAMAKKHFQTVDRKEVERMRDTVLGLQKLGDGFTKEVIVAKGDPAMRRLQEVLVIGRYKVLKESESLQQERQKLMGMGSLWEKCQRRLYEQLSETMRKALKPPSFEQYLQGEEQMAAILAMPMDPQTRAVLSENARLASQLDPEEARGILALNVTRSLLGLPMLLIDLKLCEAARDHSHDMDTRKFFSHESPVEGKKTFGDRAKRMGTTASSENIAAGVREGKAANMMWFHSPGHHRNMLGQHRRVGLGRSGGMFTEMFGG